MNDPISNSITGSAGDGAAPTFLLAPALLAGVAWAIWDRAGRPELRPSAQQRTPARARNEESFARAVPRRQPHPEGRIVRNPRNPAAGPPADGRIRAQRTARRHVRAALHGAGSQAGLP